MIAKAMQYCIGRRKSIIEFKYFMLKGVVEKRM